jgi:hypothetical protein
MSPKVSAGLNLFRRSERNAEMGSGAGFAKKARHRCRAFLIVLLCLAEELEIHTTHAAHAAAARRHAGAGASVLLRRFRNHGFGGDQECRN